jgi:hypothetical protein
VLEDHDRRGGVGRSVGALLGVVALLLPIAARQAQALPESGCHVVPTVYCVWDDGQQRLDLGADTRFRIEWWDGFKDDWSTFYALRTRVRAKYSVKDIVTVFAEGQGTQIWSLGSDSSGAGALYRRFTPSGSGKSTDGYDIRQGWLEVKPMEQLAIRAGRTDLKLGTQAMYKEPNWKYIKIKRQSQRMVGGVGWTHGERSNDGGWIAYNRDGYDLLAFGAMPTTGVFDISNAYETQTDIVYGGISLTALRDTWLSNTEVRPFFLAYSDQRPLDDGGLTGGVEVYTLGASLIGIYPVGPGNLDVFAWIAGQVGDYTGRNHEAGAGILELGYQLPDVMFKPWLRAGINVASGGGAEGRHGTFFNMLPTNHLYYGFADQLAFQNLFNPFVQLMLKLPANLGLNVFYHYFALVDNKDGQYFGSGAFTQKGPNSVNPGAFGFGARPSFGHNTVGQEVDVVLNWNATKWLSVQGGYAHLFGGAVLKANVADGKIADEDAKFGYLQIALKY